MHFFTFFYKRTFLSSFEYFFVYLYIRLKNKTMSKKQMSLIVDQEVFTKFKVKCAMNGKTMSSSISEYMENQIKGINDAI